ncbi:MAG TPA: hypothetical protein VLG69_03405 [Candidatus Andersenbacteria bacterium]|nr:hypothetical protein [Candidatus Andersenbacteria bacterium]
MTNQLPIVLIVEDSIREQERYLEALKEKVVIVPAKSLQEANTEWENAQNIALIVMDGCVNNHDFPDTQPLIKKIRETFKGPMIAASSSSIYRQALLQAGCDHEAHKDGVPAKVLELLGLS